MKKNFLKNPTQEAYLVSKDGTQKYRIVNGEVDRSVNLSLTPAKPTTMYTAEQLEQIKNRIKYHTPSDKNKNFKLVRPDGSKMSKKDFLQDPTQEAYIEIQTGTNAGKQN